MHSPLSTSIIKRYIPHMNWIPLLRLLPRNLISNAFGVIARSQLPLFAPAFRDWFVSQFRIDMSDAEKKQHEYKSAADLFTRALQPGARPLASDSLVSPVDGLVSQCGVLEDHQLLLIQAKGRTYSLANLLRDSKTAERFQGGAWAVIYLAPHNYHRIHSPMEGSILSAMYCPGTLWPVNASSVQQIDDLFCVNERVTTQLSTPQGELLVVKVGATNVGRISLAYSSHLITNSAQVPSPVQAHHRWEPTQPISVTKGEHLGTFELGSTVVLILDKSLHEANPGAFVNWLGKPVRMGQSLR